MTERAAEVEREVAVLVLDGQSDAARLYRHLARYEEFCASRRCVRTQGLSRDPLQVASVLYELCTPKRVVESGEVLERRVEWPLVLRRRGLRQRYGPLEGARAFVLDVQADADGDTAVEELIEIIDNRMREVEREAMNNAAKVERTVAWLALSGKGDVARLYGALARYEAACFARRSAPRSWDPRAGQSREIFSMSGATYRLVAPGEVVIHRGVLATSRGGNASLYSALAAAEILGDEIGGVEKVIGWCVENIERRTEELGRQP